MYFPFLITLQQEKTERRKDVLLKRKADTICKPVGGIKEAIQKSNDACQFFKEEIKSPFNKIKSYIPFTKMFNDRLLCAKRLSRLNNLLDKVENNLKEGKPRTPVKKPLNVTQSSPSKLNGASPLKKSLSFSTEPVYKSPVGAPIRKNHSAPIHTLTKPSNMLPILLKL